MDYAVSKSANSIWEAAKDGDGDEVRRLVDSGAEINGSVMVMQTPLVMAARYGLVDMSRLLIELGADVNFFQPVSKFSRGGSALSRAAEKMNLDLCRVLLDAGADPNVQPKRGVTPLHEVLQGTSGRDAALSLCELLLQRGADPNAQATQFTSAECNRDAEKIYGERVRSIFTPLHCVLFARGRLEKLGPAGSGGATRAIEMLLYAGADPSFVPPNPQGNYLSPLQLAAKLGAIEELKVLLSSEKADIAQRTVQGKTLRQLGYRNPAVRELLASCATSKSVEDAISAGEPKGLEDQPVRRHNRSIEL